MSSVEVKLSDPRVEFKAMATDLLFGLSSYEKKLFADEITNPELSMYDISDLLKLIGVAVGLIRAIPVLKLKFDPFPMFTSIVLPRLMFNKTKVVNCSPPETIFVTNKKDNVEIKEEMTSDEHNRINGPSWGFEKNCKSFRFDISVAMLRTDKKKGGLKQISQGLYVGHGFTKDLEDYKVNGHGVYYMYKELFTQLNILDKPDEDHLDKVTGPGLFLLGNPWIRLMPIPSLEDIIEERKTK